jgi:protein phosphatase
MQFAHRSDLGYVRTRNEDAVFVTELPDGALLAAVADGMGGHPAGDVASRVAIGEIAARAADVPSDPDRVLAEVLQAAHSAVLAAAATEPAYFGMGTTAVVAHVHPARAYVAHVGDSRAYRLRAGRAEQLTHDHNRLGYLTQALGTAGGVSPESLLVEVAPGDRLLLCTDGLSGLLPAEAIAAAGSAGSVTDACDRLVDAALAAGGYDNVTVVLVEV